MGDFHRERCKTDMSQVGVQFTYELFKVGRLKSFRIIRKQKMSLKEITSQTDQHLASLSSKTYAFEDKMTRHKSARPVSSFCVPLLSVKDN